MTRCRRKVLSALLAAAVPLVLTKTIAGAQSPARCPIYESRNWKAWIERPSDQIETAQLHLTGQIDLPTPGYEIDWQPGALDRRQPPSLRIMLTLRRPEGTTLQVIDTQDIAFQMETQIRQFRSIQILCGDRVLVEIPNVTIPE